MLLFVVYLFDFKLRIWQFIFYKANHFLQNKKEEPEPRPILLV